VLRGVSGGGGCVLLGRCRLPCPPLLGGGQRVIFNKRMPHQRPCVLAHSPDALRVSITAVMLELRIFKYGESELSSRVFLLIPSTGDEDHIRGLFLRLLVCAPEFAAAVLWFNQPHLVAARTAWLRVVAALPPPSARFTPRFLCSGGITAACAVGVPLEWILRLSNHPSAAVVMR
jgi:hypothetical protein